MAAYCAVEDITLGSMEPPRGLDVQWVIEQKADDIDAVVGRVYKLPFSLSMTDPEQRPWALMFKKCNAYLTIGEIFLQAGSARQDDAILAIANQYLRQAMAFLNGIEAGRIVIPFLERLAPESSDVAPLIVNRDSFSRVEEFYNPQAPGLAPWVGTGRSDSPWG